MTVTLYCAHIMSEVSLIHHREEKRVLVVFITLDYSWTQRLCKCVEGLMMSLNVHYCKICLSFIKFFH